MANTRTKGDGTINFPQSAKPGEITFWIRNSATTCLEIIQREISIHKDLHRKKVYFHPGAVKLLMV